VVHVRHNTEITDPLGWHLNIYMTSDLCILENGNLLMDIQVVEIIHHTNVCVMLLENMKLNIMDISEQSKKYYIMQLLIMLTWCTCFRNKLAITPTKRFLVFLPCKGNMKYLNSDIAHSGRL